MVGLPWKIAVGMKNIFATTWSNPAIVSERKVTEETVEAHTKSYKRKCGLA